MNLRALVAALVVVATGGGITATPASAAPPSTSEVVALVVEGTGFGHGRGLSQWGSYGWAVNSGWSWTQILDHYYGGTTLGDVPLATFVKVRLTALDGAANTGVISTTSSATWNGTPARAALQARETAPNVYSVYGSTTPRCPSSSLTGWTLLASNVTGPVLFTTLQNQSTAAAGDVLGVCQPNGSVVHYRGAIRAVNDSSGANRTVNEVLVENYLRGVISREVSSSWGNAGGGAGMNALRAQAVAARSYGLAQNRYPYATTCDTTSCQVYGGSAYRATPTSPTSTPGTQVCESGNTTFECLTTNRAIADTAGKVRRAGGAIVSTEFSASNGPRTAGGTFPPVDDPADDVPANPNHRWTRVLDAHSVMARYGLGTPVAGTTERDPATIYDGVWGNRVRLTGSAGSTVVSALAFRSAYGLPSHGFTIRAVTRSVATPHSLAMIGDSIGVSVSETSTSELPALLDRVFAGSRFDSVVSRCTTGCGTNNGLVAAQQVPIGTGLVVVELGYNDRPTAGQIDQLMAALRQRDVVRVLWVNLADRIDGRYAATNAAIAAARSRWPELEVADWNAASTGISRARWFASDGVHLTSTGQAQFALFLRERVLSATTRLGRLKVSPTAILRVPVRGLAGVPTSGVTGVSWNVTATDANRVGWATVWPCDAPRPNASNVNFGPGAPVANAVVAGVTAGGEVCVSTSSPAHLVIDSSGWLGAGFGALTPSRAVDTRSGPKVAPNAVLRVSVLGRGGVPSSGVRAVAVNITVIDPAAAGWATVWPCDTPKPATSNVNFVAGQTVANAVIAGLGPSGQVCVAPSVAAHLAVDTTGYFTSGYTPVAPARLYDSRPRGPIPAGGVARVPVRNRAGIPASGVAGVALNVTAVDPATTGWATVWPCDTPKPATSNVNVGAGAIVANAVLSGLGPTGEVCVSVSTATDVLVDVSGWFGGVFHPIAPQRIVDTRTGTGPTPGP